MSLPQNTGDQAAVDLADFFRRICTEESQSGSVRQPSHWFRFFFGMHEVLSAWFAFERNKQLMWILCKLIGSAQKGMEEKIAAFGQGIRAFAPTQCNCEYECGRNGNIIICAVNCSPFYLVIRIFPSVPIYCLQCWRNVAMDRDLHIFKISICQRFDRVTSAIYRLLVDFYFFLFNWWFG